MRNVGRNVILIENSRTGKTHMAIAIGILACEENHRVSFPTAAGLMILDELGYVTFHFAGAELLFQLLATRYETCRET